MDCPDCNSDKIYVDWLLGEYYCYDCGLMIEDNIIDFSDISFIFDENGKLKNYSNTDPTRPDKGLGAMQPRSMLQRFTEDLQRRITFRPVENVERSFFAALPALRRVWKSLDLPKGLRVDSAMIYRRCIKKRLTKGRITEGMAIAAVYVACTRSGMQNDMSRAAKALSVPMDTVQAYSRIVEGGTAPQTRFYVRDYVKKGIESLKLPQTISEKAFEICKKVLSQKLEIGKHPAVVAGAIIYKAGLENKEEISQERIAKALGVSERSVRRMTKILL